MLELIKEISAISGISGRENAVREYIIKKIEGCAEYRVDPLGSLIVFKKGKKTANKKVMLDAHMDEVGFIITGITADGCLRFAKVGGVDTRVALGRSVKVGKDGISGVLGAKPIHLLEKDEEDTMPKNDDLYIDIGASSREEAEKYVAPGDAAWFDCATFEMGDGFLKSKALDDRVGCAVLIEMIRSELEYDTWFSFSVQEEVGLRGAGPAAYGIDPDYALALETTTAADITGVKDEKRVCICGKGPAVSFMDRTTVYDRSLFDTAFAVAAENGIPCQVKTFVSGGNNSGAIHKVRCGVKSLTLSVPCRYLHSPSCVIKYSDAESCLKLAKALATELAK